MTHKSVDDRAQVASHDKAAPIATTSAASAITADEAQSNVLKMMGGSLSDDWNNLLGNQAVDALPSRSDHQTEEQRTNAVVAALIGIAPKDELESMVAAQLLAAHNAAMDCYRRATMVAQTPLGRTENLSQATKLSRTFATLLETLNRHRGKGQQKVTVEHVHVHSGGQAVVGVVERAGGGGDATKS